MGCTPACVAKKNNKTQPLKIVEIDGNFYGEMEREDDKLTEKVGQSFQKVFRLNVKNARK
jgi:hypothetical protein